MAALGDFNAVTSQFIYQEWGIEMPTLREIAAPFQPIVEMLCCVESLCQSRTLVELAVTESSSPGFWLSEATVATLFQAGVVERHQKVFGGLLSCFRLWSPWPHAESQTKGTVTDGSIAQQSQCGMVEGGMATQQGAEYIQGSSLLEENKHNHLASLDALQPVNNSVSGAHVCVGKNADMDFADASFTASPSCNRPPDGAPGTTTNSCAIDIIEGTIADLTIEDDPGPFEDQDYMADYYTNTDHQVTSDEIEEDSDDEQDNDYWQWDAEKQQYRHWDESHKRWVYFPETFH
jgi:hypothetical protein